MSLRLAGVAGKFDSFLAFTAAILKNKQTKTKNKKQQKKETKKKGEDYFPRQPPVLSRLEQA